MTWNASLLLPLFSAVDLFTYLLFAFIGFTVLAFLAGAIGVDGLAWLSSQLAKFIICLIIVFMIAMAGSV